MSVDVRVAGCSGCPFHDGQYDECRRENRSCTEDRGEDATIPRWCPLRDDDVNVTLDGFMVRL